jgi:glucose/arabinose dehydrogenase
MVGVRFPGSCRRRRLVPFILAALLALLASSATTERATGQAQPVPTLLVPDLALRTVVDGLALPTSIAFLGPNDLLVLEKNSGKVKRVVNGVVRATVLDLAVNFGSERGLLGIALHPDFPSNPGVYLFWTESSTGADTDVLSQTPLLGNRVDRFLWNGSTLTFERNLIRLRAIQHDFTTVTTAFGTFTQPERGNHDGGVIAFGPDRKLYVLFGDVGRRGQLQNLRDGPFGPGIPDDQFGGPQPDNAHLSGIVLRLNDDGSTPADNPFVAAGATIGGEVGANVQRVFSYGLHNSFGMAFDPASGALWTQENGEDAFDELNRVERGQNSGWVQIAGPASRVAEYKAIETTALHHEDFPNLQQFRWGPERIADTPAEALSRLFVVPGSRYREYDRREAPLIGRERPGRGAECLSAVAAEVLPGGVFPAAGGTGDDVVHSRALSRMLVRKPVPSADHQRPIRAPLRVRSAPAPRSLKTPGAALDCGNRPREPSLCRLSRLGRVELPLTHLGASDLGELSTLALARTTPPVP